MSLRRLGLWLLSLAILVGSAIQVVVSTHRVRQLHMTLQELQAERDTEVEEYSRLQLELAAAAAYQNIERTAEEALGMSFPDEVERVNP